MREDPEQREHDDADHELGGFHQVAGLENQEADARVGCDLLGGHQQEQRDARSQPEAGEDHGQSRGQDDLANHAPPPGPEGDGRPDQQRVGLADARIGVDRHREEDAERHHRHLGGLADAEPEDEQRQQRDLGDGERGRDERLDDRVGQGEEPDGHAHADAGQRADREAQARRSRLVARCTKSWPETAMSQPSASTPSGDGRKSADTKPVRVISSQSTTRPDQREDAHRAVVRPPQERGAIVHDEALDRHQPRSAPRRPRAARPAPAT